MPFCAIHLERAILFRANMSGAGFLYAYLNNAYLAEARMDGARYSMHI